jgi:asparagine synthase (glutamine-hydrolysing)
VCGIAGFLHRTQRPEAGALRERVLAMADALAHRGPDDRGAFVDAAAGMALGHRRLSILDLSKAGAQPMTSACGRFVLSYNGEIYGFASLVRELEGRGLRFRGHSDTEVLVESIAAFGLEATLSRLNGMFAFALWDVAARRLTLVRDRAGKKPLYHGRSGDVFLFGSELSALESHPDFRGEVDRDALGLLVRYGWIPAPHAIYESVRKLEAGSLLHVEADGRERTQRWWSARELAERGERDPFRGSYEQAVDALEARLSAAVARRTVADVPVGALLSGGIDSTAVVALMARHAPSRIRTYTIGFDEERFDEAAHARAVAERLGTEHTELRVTARDALELIPALPRLYDEPLADASQLPTHLVCRLARRQVKVALSGDGGDELFVGYKWHLRARRLWERQRRWPWPVRRAAGAVLRSAAAVARRSGLGGAGLEKRGVRLGARDARELFARLHWRCSTPEAYLRGGGRGVGLFDDRERWASTREPDAAFLQMDFAGFLADDVLQKVDRASMAVGLEVRCPLLDREVLELAWALPIEMRLDASGGKRVLKDVLARHVPRALFERPKHGFGVPVAAWLRGPLREWAESLLDPSVLRADGFFRAAAVERVFRDHLAERTNADTLLWSVLSFQAWLDSRRS